MAKKLYINIDLASLLLIILAPGDVMGTLHNLPNKSERRKYDRQNIQTEIILFNSKGLFRTRSLNLSLSGALLSDRVPESMCQQEMDVIIVIKNADQTTNRILLKAVMIGGPERSSRLCFRNIVAQQFYKLQRLLGQELMAA